MIRRWPTFYLDDKEDRAVFDAWDRKYRSHVWSRLEKQAKRAGVAIERLREGNIVFDVRFNEDLGCTVQPLMLVDDATHVQIHGSQAGASVVVPLWPRRRSTALPQAVLDLGSSNRTRAAALVKQAGRHTCIEGANQNEAILCLWLAFACHPPEAGRLILQEWSNRLGRDTHDEFERASYILSAVELCSKFRYKEAVPLVNKYLSEEPHPIGDAYIIAALCQLVDDETALRELKEKDTRRLLLLENLRETIGTEPAHLDQQQLEKLVRSEPHVSILLESVTRLAEQIENLNARVKQDEVRRRALIDEALHNPDLVSSEHAALAQAARVAPDALRMSMDTNCLYAPARSEALADRYGDTRYIVEMRALFEIIHDIALIASRITYAADVGRSKSVAELERISHALWLPDSVEQDLKQIIAKEEFEKEAWDYLLVDCIHSCIVHAVDTCQHRLQDLFSDPAITSIPLAEAITTRIHFSQVVQHHYRTALEMLLNAKVPFGRATRHPWAVLNHDYREMPEDGRLAFDPRDGIVYLISPTGRVPLLQTEKVSDVESEYVGRIIADPCLPSRLWHHAPTLAERILAAEVEPSLEWLLWRDVMAAVKDELLLTMANFDDASLMPEYILPKTPDGEELYLWMDVVPPRSVPVLDMIGWDKIWRLR